MCARTKHHRHAVCSTANAAAAEANSFIRYTFVRVMLEYREFPGKAVKRAVTTWVHLSRVTVPAPGSSKQEPSSYLNRIIKLTSAARAIVWSALSPASPVVSGKRASSWVQPPSSTSSGRRHWGDTPLEPPYGNPAPQAPSPPSETEEGDIRRKIEKYGTRDNVIPS